MLYQNINKGCECKKIISNISNYFGFYEEYS